MALEIIKILDSLTNCIRELPRMAGLEAVNFSKERFVQQNWFDAAPIPWEPRRRLRRGGKKRQNGAILVDSGRLKRSIRIVSVTPTSVIIGTDVPYAQMHNDGFKGTQNVKAYRQRVKAHKRRITVKTKKGTKKKTVQVKAHTRKIAAHQRKVDMPRRQFIGKSAELERRLELLITNELTAAINEALTTH